MQKITTLHQLFVHGLNDIYSAEEQILSALPGVIQNAQNVDLKESLQNHLEETREHIERLNEIFEMLGETKETITCKAMEGLLAEGEEGMNTASPAVIDLAITTSGERIEHYEMAAYTSLYEMAKQMGHSEEAALLKETLIEEEAASDKLEEATEELLALAPTGM